MYSQLKGFAFLLCLVFGLGSSASAADVTITPGDLEDTAADATATPPVAFKSAQDKVAEKIAGAGAGDTVTFPSGTYDDVGEILITKAGEPSDDPDTMADEGDGPIVFRGEGTVFTGKIMFNVKASHVVIRGFTFSETEVPDAVTINTADTDSAATGTQPLVYGFPGMTVLEYLVSKEAETTDGGDAYTAITPIPANTLNNEVDNAWIMGYNSQRFISGVDDKGTAATADDEMIIVKADDGKEVLSEGREYRVGTSARPTASPPVLPSISMMASYAKDGMGTIWVDSVSKEACPASAAPSVQGVVIRDNVFRKTELTGVKAGQSPLRLWVTRSYERTVAGFNSCPVSIDVIANDFADVGGNGPFARSAAGRLFMRDGNSVPEIGNREPAIEIVNAVSSNIRSNTIAGGTAAGIRVLRLPAKTELNIMNNEITDTILSGIVIEDETLASTNKNAKIAIAGNLITGGSDNRYLTAPFMSGYRDSSYNLDYDHLYHPAVISGAAARTAATVAADCRDYDATLTGTDLADLIAREKLIHVRLELELWRSDYGNDRFGNGGAPASIIDADTTVHLDNGIKFRPAIATSDTGMSLDVIGATSLIGFDAGACYNIARIRIANQEGVSITGNDLGYTADLTGPVPQTAPDYGVAVEGSGTELAAFSGNNIDSAGLASVISSTGEAIPTKGNYLGRVPRVQTGLDGSPEFASDSEDDPVAAAGRVVGQRDSDTDPDEEAPGAPTAEVNAAGNIVLTYGEALDGDSEPDGGDFTVTRSCATCPAGRGPRVSLARVSGMTVTLTLTSKINAGDTVTVSYSGDAIRDIAGNMAASFTNRNVTNDLGDGGGGATRPPAPAPAGDGGCALASSAGSGPADLGMLLPLAMMAVAFGFRVRRS